MAKDKAKDKAKPIHYQYCEIVRRPSDGDMLSSFKLPEHLIGTYLDPELWAYSTLPPCDEETLVCIYEVKQGNFTSRLDVRQRMWLHDLLDDNDIPYQVEMKGYWAARKHFSEIQCISVEETNEKKARDLIKEYNDPDNWIQENPGGGTGEDISVDGVPQKKCPSCGENIDFDYHKCPVCKSPV